MNNMLAKLEAIDLDEVRTVDEWHICKREVVDIYDEANIEAQRLVDTSKITTSNGERVLANVYRQDRLEYYEMVIEYSKRILERLEEKME